MLPKKTSAVFAALGLLLAASPTDAATKVYGKPVGEYSSEMHDFRVVELFSGLDRPWGMAFLPGGDMLVTEKPGRLWRLSADGSHADEIAGVPAVYDRGQGGLLDVAPDPDFEANRTIFLCYSAETDGGAHTHLARARLAKDRLEDVRALFAGKPGRSGGRHFGCRIVFWPDGTLGFTTGDRGAKTPAQDLGDHAGKVIRLNRDGSIPANNPFRETEGAWPEIFSYGHRNPQGAAIHPETGMLWLHEHGPRGGDEVNIVRAGADYGWPSVSHGVNYSGTPVGTGQATAPGIEPPVHTWVPSIAPSGMAFYDGAAFPEWRGNMLVGALKYQLVVRLTLDGNRVVGEERLLTREFGRIRDVRVGPNGLVYLLTDSRNGRLLRLESTGR